MFVYATLDDSSICDGISILSGEVIQDNMISIENDNLEYYIWRKYENGQWSEEKYEPETISSEEITLLERVANLEAELEALLTGGAA